MHSFTHSFIYSLIYSFFLYNFFFIILFFSFFYCLPFFRFSWPSNCISFQTSSFIYSFLRPSATFSFFFLITIILLIVSNFYRPHLSPSMFMTNVTTMNFPLPKILPPVTKILVATVSLLQVL